MTDPLPDSPAPQPPADAASPLEQVVDDYAPRRDAVEWATAELLAGRTFDEVSDRLGETGWSPIDVGEIIEESRQRTVGARGVLTRDQVLRNVNRHYQRGMTGGWFVGFPMVAAAMRLIYSVANLVFLRRSRRRRPDQGST